VRPGEESGASHRDVIVIGSGFGGSLAAWPLVREGLDVLMLERGPWVERGPESWSPENTLIRTPYFDGGGDYEALTGGEARKTAACSCVGGASVFYGAVSLRYREEDFRPNPEIVTDSGARWPLRYEDLRPYYRVAERILSVSGEAGGDPTAPSRRRGYPSRLNSLSAVSGVIADAARERGLSPFRLPLAINYHRNGNGGQPACVECGTCDTFACAIGAKNDLATRVLPVLMRRGLELRSRTAVTRLHVEGDRVVAADCVDRRTGKRRTYTADTFIVAAGALGSAHLLLASGLEERNPAGESVGRYLTRHCSSMVYGAYSWLPAHEGRFHKQMGINDYYLGDPDGRGPRGKLGNIQQAQTPSMGQVETEATKLGQLVLRPIVRRATGMLVIAEDRPRPENGVSLDRSITDELGMPKLVIRHQYTDRDLAARSFLVDRAEELHGAAGAMATFIHDIDTFSHALGTVRMGEERESNPLDPQCRFRGLSNLHVSDGSALPTSSGVNPSLTIAANALRVGEILAESARSGARAGSHAVPVGAR